MFDELLATFQQSQHAQNAVSVLQAQGIPEDQAQQILAAALPGAIKGMTAMTADHPEPSVGLFNLFGGHAGREFLAGAAAGLLRGDGVWGSLKDGAVGMLAGHVAEVIAERTGMDPTMAGQVAAVVTPFIAHYAHEKLAASQ